MSYILLQGGLTEAIKEVWLFDGLYGQLEKFAMWLERYNGRFVHIFTLDGGTFGTTADFVDSLEAWGIPYQRYEDHSGAPGPALPEQSVVFWFTDLGHNEVLHARRYFFKLLSSSKCLK